MFPKGLHGFITDQFSYTGSATLGRCTPGSLKIPMTVTE